MRYAATAKAPSWASSDWHPLKAVLANGGAAATTGTGVFLPHLAEAPKPAEGKQGAAKEDAAGGAGPSASSSAGQPASPRDGSPACSVDGMSMVSDPFSRASTLDFSRASTVDFARQNSTSTFADGSGANADGSFCHSVSHGVHASGAGCPCPLSAMAEEPEIEAAQAAEDECDFSALARELADLMGRQGLTEEVA